MIALRVLIAGRVQGVSFRWYTVEQANRLGVRGWVRNLPDGRVEALVEGEPEAVERMVEWLRTGPRMAQVDDVAPEEVTATGVDSFRIAH